MTTHAPESGPQSTKDRAAEVGGTAKEQTGQVAGSAKEQAASVAATAKEQAVDVAHDAADQARDLLEELRTTVRDQVGTQRDKLSQTLDQYATELRQMAERSDSDGPATEAVRQIASKLQDVKSYLDGGGDVATDVRRFARRRPGTFLFACAAVGVLAGRATRGAAAARSQQQGGAGRHAVDTDGEPQWRRPYDADEFGGPYDGEQVNAGVERTSDPNLRPTSGPLVSRESAYGGQSATGASARAVAGDPVPPDLDPRDVRVDRDLSDSGTRPRADGPWERGER